MLDWRTDVVGEVPVDGIVGSGILMFQLADLFAERSATQPHKRRVQNEKPPARGGWFEWVEWPIGAWELLGEVFDGDDA
jgi:hypothetical protein